MFFSYVNHIYPDHMLSNMCILTISSQLIRVESILISVANPKFVDLKCAYARTPTVCHKFAIINAMDGNFTICVCPHIFTHYAQWRSHCVSLTYENTRAHTHTTLSKCVDPRAQSYSLIWLHFVMEFPFVLP